MAGFLKGKIKYFMKIKKKELVKYLKLQNAESARIHSAIEADTCGYACCRPHQRGNVCVDTFLNPIEEGGTRPGN